MTDTLTPYERRLLDAMQFNEWYSSRKIMALGFRTGINWNTRKHLQELGYIDVLIVPAKGHEDDWRTTGRYWEIIKKLKDWQTPEDYQI